MITLKIPMCKLIILPLLPSMVLAGTPDLNLDGLVNAADLSIFKANYFHFDTEADINLDGIVNANDFALFKQSYFKPAPTWRLKWIPSSEREDGTALSLSEIQEYKIYCGIRSEDYTHVTTVDDTAYTLTSTRYCVVTTIDKDGRESQYSNEIKLQL